MKARLLVAVKTGLRLCLEADYQFVIPLEECHHGLYFAVAWGSLRAAMNS
jgi:hypothetical protein